MSVCLSVDVSISGLFIYLITDLSIYLSMDRPIYRSVYLSACHCLPIYPSARPSINRSTHSPTHPPIPPSACVDVCTCTSVCTYHNICLHACLYVCMCAGIYAYVARMHEARVHVLYACVCVLCVCVCIDDSLQALYLCVRLFSLVRSCFYAKNFESMQPIRRRFYMCTTACAR